MKSFIAVFMLNVLLYVLTLVLMFTVIVLILSRLILRGVSSTILIRTPQGFASFVFVQTYTYKIRKHQILFRYAHIHICICTNKTNNKHRIMVFAVLPGITNMLQTNLL